MRSSTEDVVPNSTNSFNTRKNMRKPGQYPWNNEDDQVNFSKALKYLLKLLIFTDQH